MIVQLVSGRECVADQINALVTPHTRCFILAAILPHRRGGEHVRDIF
jgi:hypothetical protein